MGDWPGLYLGNQFLRHLRARAFSPATVGACAYDVANLARFLGLREIGLAGVEPMDVLAWGLAGCADAGVRRDGRPVRPPRGAAPATINRRVAAVRSFFEFLVMSRVREANPVPAPRESSRDELDVHRR